MLYKPKNSHSKLVYRIWKDSTQKKLKWIVSWEGGDIAFYTRSCAKEWLDHQLGAPARFTVVRYTGATFEVTKVCKGSVTECQYLA